MLEGGISRTAALEITVDADASRKLTEELADFLEDVPLPVDFGIIVIGSATDGEILVVKPDLKLITLPKSIKT